MAERRRDEHLDDADQEGLMQLVGFMIGAEQFGVDILNVQEIIRTPRITTVPNSPDFVEGVINLRGDIIPVVDLRKRLNIFTDKSAKRIWVVILDVDGKVVGFIVDRVTEVLKVNEDKVEPPPDIVIAGLESQYIEGVCELSDNNLLVILNFDRVLLVEEMKELATIDADEYVLDDELVLE